MADKLMYILNDDTKNYPYNYWLKRLDTQFNTSLQRIRIRYYKTLGTSAIISPISPSSLSWFTADLKANYVFD